MIEIRLMRGTSRFQEINNLLKELSPGIEPIERYDLGMLHDENVYLENRRSFIFTVLDSEKKHDLVGMAAIFFIWKCSGWMAEIHDMVVSPEYRGRHIGDMLMKKLLEVAKAFAEEKSKKITIYLTSKPHRVAANKMYQKHGFKLVARAEGEEGTNLYKLVIEPSE